MEIAKKRRGILKNLSLKWSFMLYVVLFMSLAVIVGASGSMSFNEAQNHIYQHYEDLYHDELGARGDLVVNGNILEGEGVWIYRVSITSKFSEKDLFLYKLYGALSTFTAPIIIIIGVILCGVTFYLRKLKKPLIILNEASERIANGDLDFLVVYDSKNEFGKLVSSFNIMRESVYQTNKEMWHTIEDRKCINAAFAHDLRTPLTVLKGYCELLLKYLPNKDIDEQKTLATLSMMNIYIKRLEGYTDTMTSLQKLQEINPSPNNILFSEFCLLLTSTAEQLATSKELVFDYKGEHHLFIDSALALQVFENLISNAVRYAKTKIIVTCNVSNSMLCIAVCDDGDGFTETALSKATKQPYFRDEKDVLESAHFGIGLFVSKLLCEKQGGQLILKNIKNSGSEVTASFYIESKSN